MAAAEIPTSLVSRWSHTSPFRGPGAMDRPPTSKRTGRSDSFRTRNHWRIVAKLSPPFSRSYPAAATNRPPGRPCTAVFYCTRVGVFSAARLAAGSIRTGALPYGNSHARIRIGHCSRASDWVSTAPRGT